MCTHNHYRPALGSASGATHRWPGTLGNQQPLSGDTLHIMTSRQGIRGHGAGRLCWNVVEGMTWRRCRPAPGYKRNEVKHWSQACRLVLRGRVSTTLPVGSRPARGSEWSRAPGAKRWKRDKPERPKQEGGWPRSGRRCPGTGWHIHPRCQPTGYRWTGMAWSSVARSGAKRNY